MVVKLSLLILLFLPLSMIAQTVTDAEFDRIVKTDCDGKAFTKTEIKPSLKISRKAYGDSLMSYLLSKNGVIKNSALPCRFFLTSHSQIVDIRVGDKPTPIGLILRDAILHFKDLLKPAVHNSRTVCSYVTFMVEFKKDRINVAILQGF